MNQKMRWTFILGAAALALAVAGIGVSGGSRRVEPPPITGAALAAAFPKMRIENEYKLVIPREIAEEVWAYLVSRLVDDKTFIQSLDPGLDSYWNDERFIDVYFDTPDLVMLGRKSGVRHRTRFNLTDEKNRKHGRQLMQVKLNGIDDNPLNRGELKFDIERTAKLGSADDVHPVIGLVKRADREAFKDAMRTLGLDPYALRKILVNEERRRSIYLPRDGKQFISIRLDECASDLFWARWRHVELEPELNEIPYTQGGPEIRAHMETVNRMIVEDVVRRFPAIRADQTPKYNKAFEYFSEKIPLLRFVIEHGLDGG